MPGQGGPLVITRESLALASLLLIAFGLRAIAPDQPIVENYVGRQIPTAMVARNLERGSGFFWPQLDTAPFPNLFLVEPPLFAAVVVAVCRASGLALEPAGRLVSAFGTALAVWGLYGLTRRREGHRCALLAAAALASFPITIRYGRAFQPDALMLGSLVAGVRCWDEQEQSGRLAWGIAGALLMATGFALKIVSAYYLIPLAMLLCRPPVAARRWVLGLLLLPALLWYVRAVPMVLDASGSRASADNGVLWLRLLIPTALFQHETWENAERFVCWRGFTPFGFALALTGLRGADRLWRIWGVSALTALTLLAGKLHHEYYWLALAPLAAVGVGRSLAALSERRPVLASMAGLMSLGLCLYQVRTTWQTPPEWAHLGAAARVVRQKVPRDAWVVAPEALLYAADRRGCRLEYAPAAARRAAGEWGEAAEVDSASDLLEFYRARGARFVAVPGVPDAAGGRSPARLALQEMIRRRYNVLIEERDILLAALEGPSAGGSPDGCPK